MTTTRLQTNDRMSQCVIHNETVYLAGQVALSAPGESVENQTKAIEHYKNNHQNPQLF